MTDIEILQLADQCGVVAVTKHEWDGKRFNHTDEFLEGDAAALVIFAKVVAQREREKFLGALRTWVGLTPEETDDIIANAIDKVDALIQTADKLKDKNT